VKGAQGDPSDWGGGVKGVARRSRNRKGGGGDKYHIFTKKRRGQGGQPPKTPNSTLGGKGKQWAGGARGPGVRLVRRAQKVGENSQ